MEALLPVIFIFILLNVILLMGTPVSFALGFLGVAGILISLHPRILPQLGTIAFNQVTSTTVIMIPLFILMAEFLANSNVAADLFDALNRRMKKLPANLAIVSVAASALFSAVCGSAPATAATIGKISIPTMLKKGYDRSFAAGTQAAAGNFGVLLPPSITLIIYGMLTETSIVRLFVAIVIPGLVILVMMIAYILIRYKLDPKMIQPVSEEIDNSQKLQNVSLKSDMLTVVPLVVLIVVVFTFLYTGIATATESAAIGAIGAGIVVLIQRRMTKECIQKTLLGTASTSCMILFLMIGGLVFALYLTLMGLPQDISAFILSASPNPWMIFIIVNIIFIILGLFMEPMSVMVIVLPFVFPSLMGMGFDAVWLGVILTINLAVSMITPPVGMTLFVLKAVTGVPIGEIFRGVVPYCVIFLLAIVIVSFFPEMATFLPGRM
jgi:C4-dicarboxylate transporter DctM subunit